jgi:general secretion pathway protein G
MRRRGFTLIELLVVLAIVALLLSVAAPRYFGSVEKSKEAVLKENLYVLRDAIDQYRADKGRYPASLEALVTDRYLRGVPVDPVTESAATWIAVAPAGGAGEEGGVFDVRSGAEGRARDGTVYRDW